LRADGADPVLRGADVDPVSRVAGAEAGLPVEDGRRSEIAFAAPVGLRVVGFGRCVDGGAGMRARGFVASAASTAGAGISAASSRKDASMM
jgi:hypothetical protein